MGTYAITGGASGIGAALIGALKEQGHRVINVDIKDADIIADLSTSDGRAAAVQGILAAAGDDGLEGFIPVAGVAAGSAPGDLITSVNYFGTIELLEGLRPALANGCIVLLSSNSAPMPFECDSYIEQLLSGDEQAARTNDEVPEGSHYMLSKRALIFWMQRNIKALGAEGIRINAVAPGPILTPMTEPLFNSEEYAPIMQSLLDQTPLPRAGQPEEVVDCILFLLSDKASYVGGTVMFIDGGYDANTRQNHI